MLYVSVVVAETRHSEVGSQEAARHQESGALPMGPLFLVGSASS